MLARLPIRQGHAALSNSSRSSIGSSGSTAAWAAVSSSRSASRSRCPSRAPAEWIAIRRAHGIAWPAPAWRRRAHVRAGRSPSSGPGSPAATRSPRAVAPGSRRARTSCPSPTARRGTCGGRSRRRPARGVRPSRRRARRSAGAREAGRSAPPRPAPRRETPIARRRRGTGGPRRRGSRLRRAHGGWPRWHRRRLWSRVLEPEFECLPPPG
jgi:hypothetical protein